MKLPNLSAPVMRKNNANFRKEGVNPSIDWLCVVTCAAALAKCAFSSDPAQCLISAGMSKCIKCL